MDASPITLDPLARSISGTFDNSFEGISCRLSPDLADPIMGSDTISDEARSLEFEILALQLSLESGRYSFMTMFMQKILNLSKDSQIVARNSQAVTNSRVAFEILPLVFLPHDLWLSYEVSIPDAMHKVALLQEANTVLQAYLGVLANEELLLVDDKKLQLMELIAQQYCLMEDVTAPATPSAPPRSPLQQITTTQEDLQSPLSKQNSQTSRPSSYQEPLTPLSRNSTLVSRMPSFQRELPKVKRKHSFLGHISLSPGPAYFETISQTSPSSLLSPLSPESAFQSPTRPPMTNIFSKSKLYSRMKRRRELQALIMSSSTTASNGGTSGAPSVRPESTISDHSGYELDKAVLLERYIENQKQKHAYYVQIRNIRESVKSLLVYLKRPGILASMIKLLEFVKGFIFKMILVDVCRMLIDYGHAKVVEASR